MGYLRCGMFVGGYKSLFLADMIPTHFTNGVADDFSNKIQILMFPLLRLPLLFLSGREKVKYCLTHSRTILTDIQYNWITDGVLILLMIAEIYVIYASFI